MERRKLGNWQHRSAHRGLGDLAGPRRARPQEDSRHEVVRPALEVGANLFDFSPMYGETERILGDALSKHGGDRATVANAITGVGGVRVRHSTIVPGSARS